MITDNADNADGADFTDFGLFVRSLFGQMKIY